jgi:hypothetical protein
MHFEKFFQSLIACVGMEIEARFFLGLKVPCLDMLVFIHMRYERYSIYYYNNECSIYREHKVTIHERMRPLNNQ